VGANMASCGPTMGVETSSSSTLVGVKKRKTSYTESKNTQKKYYHRKILAQERVHRVYLYICFTCLVSGSFLCLSL
jgi:hypothetical protein